MCNLMTKTKHIILLTIIFLFQLKAFGQTKVSDTTFISRDTSGGIYRAVYIENNKKSTYYDWLTNFKFDSSDSLSYNESIKALFKESPPKFSKTKLDSYLSRQWCGLNSYKDKFYLYAPSDWGNNSNLIITDTTIIKYFMDGPYAYIIDSFKAIDANTFEFSVHSVYRTTTKMSIHIVDWKNQIAIFDNPAEGDEYRYSLMVGSSKARQFPIIVNYCKDEQQMEFNFDKPDFKKLLKQKQ
jgi:hypothetical protein